MKKPASILASRPFVLFVLFIFIFTACFAQADVPNNRIAKKIAGLKQKGSFSKETSIFSLASPSAPDREISAILKKYTVLDTHDIESVLRIKPAYIKFSIPADNGSRQIKMLLYKENISPNGFTLLTEGGRVNTDQQDIVHYRGSIEDDLNSVVAFTFSKNEVFGFINNKEGNYVIGKTGAVLGKHIIYNDADMVEKVPFDCATNTFIPASPVALARQESTEAVATKCINWYWETDYDMFVNKGSVDNVNAYMQAIFNQMATLYANDGITVTLKTLFVWTAEDPYTGPNTSNYLNQFGAYRTTFDGDLAHLIGLKGSGGIAYINGLCKSSKYKMAYSGISSTYKAVPTYSWSVECITHEQGHLLGSPHTHDCSWNGNNTKIDGCGDAAGYPSGTCAVPALPVGGGTIMSYCHLTSTGINFNLGFGPQPTALMIKTINAATCLFTCTSCAIPSQPGTITGNSAVCAGTTQTYSVAAVSNATSYTWSLPAGWSGSSTTDTIIVTAGTAGGAISVTANDSCGSSTAQIFTATVAALPAQPGTITGNTAVCAGTSQTYSVPAVGGATSYTWTTPTGWTGTSLSNTITTTAGSAGGSFSVKSNNSCGSSSVRTVAVSITSIAPAQPANITGNTTVCQGSAQTYTTPVMAGVTSYTWALPAGWTGSSATNSITATAGSAGGNISVSAKNGCGTSSATTVALGLSPLPATPGAITVGGGSATICTGDIRTYTTPLVAGITYNWVAPAGSTINSGLGTNIIQLSFSSSFTSGSSLSVKAVNSCGSSVSSANITISKSSISRPGSITVSGGTSRVCPGDSRTYSVSKVTGITYNWTAPSGASITAGQGTNSIKITYTANFISQGILRVTANNICGTSSERTLTISRNSLTAPGYISGSTAVCPDAVATYSVALVSGAISYLWTVPSGATIQGVSTGNSIKVVWGSTGGSITVKAVNACGNSSSRLKSVSINCPSGIQALADMRATVYPNPAHDQVTIRFNSTYHSSCAISITDIVGKTITRENILAVPGINLHSFNVSKYSKGSYIVIIQGKDGKEVLRLNVE